MTKTTKARFENKIRKTETCWLWEGAEKYKGYGGFWMGGRIQRAHRAAWQLYRGEIPAGLCICHTCDVPRCVNPEHLFLGTAADNYADMARKGRAIPPPIIKGSKSHYARLHEYDVVNILTSALSTKELADLYQVAPSTIQRIISRKKWRHV